MKNKMSRIETLSFYDHTGIEKHLAKMAKKGWMIEQITNQFSHLLCICHVHKKCPLSVDLL